jgi:hypothetical protein
MTVVEIIGDDNERRVIEDALSRITDEHKQHIREVRVVPAAAGEGGSALGNGVITISRESIPYGARWVSGLIAHENDHLAGGNEDSAYDAMARHHESRGEHEEARRHRDWHASPERAAAEARFHGGARQSQDAPQPVAPEAIAEPVEAEPSGWCAGPGRWGKKSFWI